MKKEYDFRKGKKVESSRIYPIPKILISLRLEPNIISTLKDEADSLGVGYQTLIKNILEKHISPNTMSLEDKLYNRILEKLEESGVPMKKAKSKKKKTASPVNVET